MWFLYVLSLLVLLGCSNSIPQGPVNAQVLEPTGARCEYRFATKNLATIQDVETLNGKLGRVFTTPSRLGADNVSLEQGAGLNTIHLNLSWDVDKVTARDLNSWMGLSFYTAVEQFYNTFLKVSPQTDLLAIDPNLGANTFMVLNAVRSIDEYGTGELITDNAQYLPYTSVTGITKNFLFSYPTEEIAGVPLAANTGIISHEYTHLLMNYLFWSKAANTYTDGTGKTESTLAALDEGLADYFGYLTTKDASFFQCSFPQENRDLSQVKAFTSDVVASLADTSENFDPHLSGAVFASIQYEIGKRMGNPEKNGTLLVKLMNSLISCGMSGNLLSLDFRKIAQCHTNLASEPDRTLIRQVYNQYLAALGGI